MGTCSHAWTKSARIDRLMLNLTPQRPLRVITNFDQNPQAAANVDMHYELELGIVLRGRVFRGYERFVKRIDPGDVWLCGIWEPHACRVEKGPCTRLVLSILPQMLADMRIPEAPGHDWLTPFRLPPARRPNVPEDNRSKMLALAERFVESIDLPDPDRALWQRALLMEVLLLLRQPGEAPDPGSNAIEFGDRIGRAVEFIFSSRGSASAKDVAKLCGITRSRFDTVFQQTMGISFARFALRYRLSSVAIHLRKTSDALKTIAAEWGFTDASHLNRAFRAYYGCTPGEYRSGIK